MNLHKKLAEWQERGLIDEAARARIAAYEQRNAHPIWLYTVGGLGAFTIAIGLVSVVAANFEAMGRATKLGFDLLIGAGLAAGLYVAARRDKRWQTDLLAGIYYGFTLASIALLGQVYQLGSPRFHGLLAWSASTLPLLYFVRGRYVALVWLAGLVWTHTESSIALLEHLSRLGLTENREESVAANLALASLTVFIAVARAPWLVRERAQVSAAWSAALWTCTLFGGLGTASFFYSSMGRGHGLDLSFAVSGLSVLALCAWLPRAYPELPSSAHTGMRAMLGFVWVTLAVGLAYPHGEWSALAAILHVVALSLASFTALRLGRTGTFNLLTALIGVRILVMYFEVFGSMLGTGLGLVTGGILTVLLAWFWKRKSPALAARISQGENHAS